ncbi:MAG: YifB family Mg chelatase-like AAA ATPase [Desulfuromonadales bacterium]|nr:YifB family Mg chelatase-like AAA ATPase [Desulfuromonadales bacterium]
MLSKVLSAALLGIDAVIVEVEIDIAMGLPQFSTVGLPDGAVKESKDRVKAALKNSGYNFPPTRITANLAPADLKKEGAAFDLPIAIGILAATGVVKKDKLADYIILGELSLDGSVKPVKGCLPVSVMGASKRFKGIIIPEGNVNEGAIVEKIDIIAVKELSEVVAFLNGAKEITPHKIDLHRLFQQDSEYNEDFSEVRGQEHAKRALEVAAAGAHNILMIGPPGSGKTMLAKRLPTILPQMSFNEAIETTKIYSIMGLIDPSRPLIDTRPFRSPHHTISDVGLIGGGNSPKPGEVSLAHHGVLFLDELPEFKKHVLEVLRQPLEDGKVTISRALASITYPARIMLVSALNPCPCGYLNDPGHTCSCSPRDIHRYRSRMSGPLLDRIDIHIEVPAVSYKELSDRSESESSASIANRVESSREFQRERFKGTKIHCNSQMTPRFIRKYCELDAKGNRLLELVTEKLGISARSYNRILKVARTIADLDHTENIMEQHIAEAIQYRSLDRRKTL